MTEWYNPLFFVETPPSWTKQYTAPIMISVENVNSEVALGKEALEAVKQIVTDIDSVFQIRPYLKIYSRGFFDLPSWELTYPLPQVLLKMFFPFSKVGYVSSSEGPEGSPIQVTGVITLLIQVITALITGDRAHLV